MIRTYPFVKARWFREGRVKPVQLIILHSMEAPEKVDTAENVARFFSKTDTPASAHFCVDENSIIQSVDVNDTAYGAKNANANGLHIEHAGYAKQSRPDWLDNYGVKMFALSARLCAELCLEYHIPVQRAEFEGVSDPTVKKPGICGHADVPLHGTHWDPGPNFPMDYYLSLVKVQFDALTTI